MIAQNSSPFTPRTAYRGSTKLRPITLAQAREFFAAVSARMAGHLRHPGRVTSGAIWLVPTACGWLHVILHPVEHEAGSNIFSVFTRFDGTKADLAKAATLDQSVNPHTGKWNVHHTDAQVAFDRLEWQLILCDATDGRRTLATLSPDEYSAPGGPGVLRRIAHYRDHLNALRLRAEAGDLLAQRDYAAQNQDDSIVHRVQWAYIRGEINDAMRADMAQDWRAHVMAALANREPVHVAIDLYGIAIPEGYTLQGHASTGLVYGGAA